MGRQSKRFIDERQVDDLIDYYASGCEGEISNELFEYSAMLARIHSIEFKHGPRRAVSYCEKIEKLGKARAYACVTEAKELFLVDFKINKELIKKSVILELQSQSAFVKQIQQNTRDAEVFTKIQLAIAKVADVNQPDPEVIPESFYTQPPMIFTINPEDIGLDKIKIRELSNVIDSMPDIGEKYKERAKMDAGITDISFESIIDNGKEETENK